MTLIQQQRLIGAVLLLCLISVIAYFLLHKVEQSQPPAIKEEPIAFDSVIEPISEEVEVVEPVEETLVDPEPLGAVEIADESAAVVEKAPATVAPVAKTPESEAPVVKAKGEAIETAVPQPTPSRTEAESTTSQLWVLQLASFSVKKNADALAEQLKQLGYQPTIGSSSSAGTVIYRVRLQPVADRNKLEQTALSLSKKLNLSPQILQHNP